MRKLFAVLCVAAMLLMMAAPALANPSISALTVALVSAETETPLEEGMSIVVREANPEAYEDEAVRKVVSAVNSDEESMTVDEALELLKSDAELKGCDFVGQFAEIALSDGSNVAFDLDGAAVAVKATMAIDTLKGAESLEGYQAMLVNTSTGEVAAIALDEEGFNAETGEITVDFPFLGAFTMVQKA